MYNQMLLKVKKVRFMIRSSSLTGLDRKDLTFFWRKDGEKMDKQLGCEAFVPAHSGQGKVPSQVPAAAYEGSSFQDQKGLSKKVSFSLGILQTSELISVITVISRETTMG